MGNPGFAGPRVNSIAIVLGAYVAASVAGALAIVAGTRDLETIGAGLLVPLLLVPSILLYVALSRLTPRRGWRHFGYLLPAAGILTYFLVGVAMDLAGLVREGSGLAALAAFTFGVSALVTYVLLLTVDGQFA